MTTVLTAPLFDPGAGRRQMTLTEGLTLADIVEQAIPSATPEILAQCRVALATEFGSQVIEPRYWRAVRPRPGVRVVIRVVPAGSVVRQILTIVVMVAAMAFGGPLGAALFGPLGIAPATATALATLGIQVIGMLLINALIPPPKPEERRTSYQINGWKNRLDPDGAVPVATGAVRYAPPFAALPYSEIVGDWHYVRAVFNFGYGPVKLSDFRLGETALSEFDEVTLETREGLPGDAPLTIYPRQIVEDTVGVELTRNLPRNDSGDVVSGPAELTPAVRVTGADANGAAVVINFPTGLCWFDKKGRTRTQRVDVRIRARMAGSSDWTSVATLQIIAAKTAPFFRVHQWTFPQRGRWEIEVTRLTNERPDESDKSFWAALQTLRPEYPLNFPHPLALAAVRIKATHQLSGALDNLSAIVSRVCLDYDHATRTWIERETTNPASLYRYALQSAANPRPVSDSGIDLHQLEDWHNYCRLKGLRFRKVLDQTGTTLADVLVEIARAGRASPRHDGVRWGVVIDRPQELVVDHIHPRNSWGFKATRHYTKPPHAFREPFQDQTNSYEPAEMFVRWPGYTGDITLTEAMEQPGKTDPAEVWRETRRRMYEATHRPDTYEVMQDGPVRVATRGDQVALSHDILDDVQRAARVRAVQGSLIVLDELVQIAAGVDYAIRFRVFSGSDDTIGASVVRAVSAEPGETASLMLAGSGQAPRAGDMVLFGRAAVETLSLIVTGVEMTEDQACLLRLVDAAPQIEALTDAEVPPPWSGRAGTIIAENFSAPPPPRWTSIATGAAGTGAPDGMRVALAPGAGITPTALYRVSHRLQGASSWTVFDIPVAAGAADITGYSAGQAVELRAVARSYADVNSQPTDTITVTIGADDVAIPQGIDATSVVITPLPGAARIDFDVGADQAIDAVQVYASTSAQLNRTTDAAGDPITVQPARQAVALLGDTTRRNLIASAPWVLGSGWTGTGATVTHAAGSGGDASKAAAMAAGRWYRVGFSLAGGGGAITARLTGASDVSGSARTGSGRWTERFQAPASPSGISWQAEPGFAGDLSNVLLFQESAACLPQGVNYFWLEALNADGLPGPLAGPFSALIE